MSRRIEDLAPDFQDTARAVMRELEGLPVLLFQTLRTTAEQAAFWAQGRRELSVVNELRALADLPPIGEAENGDNLDPTTRKKRCIITNCDGIKVRSAHQSGRAMDIVALDGHGNPTWDYVRYAETYKAIRDAALKCGADSGGAWMKQPDGSPSPYARVGLGWDPPHIQRRY